MVYLIGNEAACMANRLSINVVSRCAGLAFYSRLSEDEIAELNGRKTRIRKTNYTIYVIYFLRSTALQEKPACVYILKLC